MAFRHLTDADCGQPNPLVRLTSHLTRDHAFAEAHGQEFPSSSDQLVEQFLQETRAAPQTFHMDGLMREMHEIESQRASLPPVPASTVKDHVLNDESWALQYLEDGKHFNVNQNHDAIWAEITAHEQANMGLRNESVWADQFFEQEEEAAAIQVSAKKLIENVDDSQFQYSKFMKFMKQVGDGEVTIKDGEVVRGDVHTWGEDYLSSLDKQDGDTLASSWAESHLSTREEGYNSKFWDRLQDEWKKLSKQEDAAVDHPWISDYNDYYDTYKEYNFSDNNPMADVQDPLGKGKEMLNIGDLPSAVLCFEAAVKKEPENPEAWQLLGSTQAENEQDPNAICALKRCIEVQPDNLAALMALAVCYTNESYHNQACQSLISWMRQNPQYASLVPPDLTVSGQVTSLLEPQHKTVQELFIRAAQQRPQDIDYEVQCGLGVLFNLSGEYDKAIDCFKAALSVKPEDARLWNRLGATLANGSRPEEAVDAYHKALNIEPGFIRARYNVGITCIKLNAYKEAAEHLLLALNQQARGRDVTNAGGLSQMSETIWSTLRMCVLLMNRTDLRSAVDSRDLRVLNTAFDVHDN